MWVKANGTVGTISPADKSLIVAPRAIQIVRGLKRRQREDLQAFLEDVEDDFIEELEEFVPNPTVEAEYIAAVPERPFLDQVETVDDIKKSIPLVEFRWRLDVIATLDELMM